MTDAAVEKTKGVEKVDVLASSELASMKKEILTKYVNEQVKSEVTNFDVSAMKETFSLSEKELVELVSTWLLEQYDDDFKDMANADTQEWWDFMDKLYDKTIWGLTDTVDHAIQWVQTQIREKVYENLAETAWWDHLMTVIADLKHKTQEKFTSLIASSEEEVQVAYKQIAPPVVEEQKESEVIPESSSDISPSTVAAAGWAAIVWSQWHDTDTSSERIWIDVVDDWNDTTLWDELWNHIESMWAINTWKNSCWKAVRSILERFWIEWLPQSWAHWYRRDDADFLDRSHWLTWNGQPIKFIKVPIETAYDALPGAIVNFDQWAWSKARSQYGHVEIRWADGSFYHYKKAKLPWGSSQWNESKAKKDPEGYKNATKFTWYAFYPVLEENYSLADWHAEDAHEHGIV